jgi:hypothetical protein
MYPTQSYNQETCQDSGYKLMNITMRLFTKDVGDMFVFITFKKSLFRHNIYKS